MAPILAKGLCAVIHQCALLLVGKCRLHMQLAWPSYLYITCPEEESDEKDAGGKWSCTERILYTVLPVCEQI